MSIEVCTGCGCRFAVGLFRCPQCLTIAPLFADRVSEETMPRITVANGPTNPDAGPGETGYMPPEGSEHPSPGISSSTSDDRPDSSSSLTRTSSDLPSPAPSTESPSSTGHPVTPGSGSAGSTDGSGPVTGSAPSRRRASSTGSRKAPARIPDSPSSGKD